jgi:hypothetical protein
VTGRRTAAVGALLLAAALAAAGCGLGPGKGIDDAKLTVTRDYGAVPIVHATVDDVTESDTVMRALERNAEITTRYGGGFVQSIEGIEGGRPGGRSHDWFFYVNGLWSPVGAAQYPLRGGEAIWWDYRDWTAGERVAAVVGSWPQPFAGGYEGERHPTAVACMGGGVSCDMVRERLRRAGATLTGGSTADAIRVLVGPWRLLRHDRDAGLLGEGVGRSGVFAEFSGAGAEERLWGLDEAGHRAHRFGPDAGLVAAVRHEEDPPTWLVTGSGAEAVAAAAARLDHAHLHDRYAIVVEREKAVQLPLR